jgi:hypothetical protein
MSRSEKRRRIRQLLAGALVGAAAIVPAAPAMPLYDAGAEGETSTTVIPYVSQGQATVPVLAGQAQSTDERAFVRAGGRPDGADTLQAQSTDERAFVRADGRPDGYVTQQPALRRGGPDGYVPQRYVTSPQQSDGDSGFDWAATGIGAGSAALLLMIAAGGALMVSRNRMTHA